MSTKAKKKSATGSKIKPKARADFYMWAGDLRRVLAKLDDDTRIYVDLHGPLVQITHWLYYPSGIEGKKTITLMTRKDDIPKKAEPTLNDIVDIVNKLKILYGETQLKAERHAKEIIELKVALSARKQKQPRSKKRRASK
jgi:hypothetical protein